MRWCARRLKGARALYRLDLEVLERLRPELIVTQALCDVCAVAEEEVTAAACSLPGAPRVVNLEPMRLSEVYDACGSWARRRASPSARRRRWRASKRAWPRSSGARARSGSGRGSRCSNGSTRPSGCGHWSPEIVRLAGGVEVIGREGEPSRTTPWSEFVAAAPDVLVVACCGFDAARTRQDLPLLASYPGFRELPAARAGRVYLVDGNAYFSRPGPRLVDSLEILAHALHPGLHPLPAGLHAAERVDVEALVAAARAV